MRTLTYTSEYELWHNAYSHLPSRSLTKMVWMDDGTRPARLSAIKQILSSPRLRRFRVKHNEYVDVPL